MSHANMVLRARLFGFEAELEVGAEVTAQFEEKESVKNERDSSGQKHLPLN
jgi:hypothetical protein